jgi:ankyrin repeat protein
MSAVINSHYKVCTILLQLPHFRNTINDTNVNGDTALHFAFITKSEEIIQLLRLHGATLNTNVSAFRFIYQRYKPTRSSLLPASCKAIPLHKRRRREQPFPHGKLTDGMTSRHKNIFFYSLLHNAPSFQSTSALLCQFFQPQRAYVTVIYKKPKSPSTASVLTCSLLEKQLVKKGK